MHVKVISEILNYKGSLMIPSRRDWRLDTCFKMLNASPGYVGVDPWIHSNINDCHNNVLRYIDLYGGERIIGYYWLEDLTNNRFLAISHSVLLTLDGKITDITNYEDHRERNLFSVSTQTSLERFSSSSVIYGFSFSFS